MHFSHRSDDWWIPNSSVRRVGSARVVRASWLIPHLNPMSRIYLSPPTPGSPTRLPSTAHSKGVGSPRSGPKSTGPIFARFLAWSGPPCPDCGSTRLAISELLSEHIHTSASVTTSLTPGRQDRDWRLRWEQLLRRLPGITKPRSGDAAAMTYIPPPRISSSS